jgi:hypothetical protein
MFKLLSIFILMASSCNGVKPKSDSLNQAIKGATVEYQIPIVKRDGTVESIQFNFQAYYFEDMTFFIFHNMFDSTINGEVVEHGFREEYFIFRNNDPFGYIYNPTRPKNNRKTSVDSLLKQRTFSSFNWEMILAFKPIGMINDLKKGTVQEIYAENNPKGLMDNDSAYFYYNKNLLSTPYSLSEKLDSIKQSKLVEVRLIFNPRHSTELNAFIPRRETYFRLSGIDSSKIEVARRYFEQYRKERQSSQ